MNRKFYQFFGSGVRTIGVTLFCGVLAMSSLPASAERAESNGAATSQQKNIDVQVTVFESDGVTPVIGAAVVLTDNNSKSALTDVNGIAKLNGIPTTGNLTVSYMGLKTQIVQIAGQSIIKVVMMEDAMKLEEVVVVGYGQQKKVNLSGSVASVDVGKMAESRPINNISSALAGMAAGVSVTSANNAPGSDNASILVRGQGTLNSSSPLIIIDGVEGNINTVSPNDVETLTVLKDAASASIYGSRAANGVILITTKKGKAGVGGKVRLDYNGYVSLENVGKLIKPVSNYADYMTYINEGFVNSKLAEPFSAEKIALWRANEGVDEYRYPNSDNMQDVFGNTGVATQHSLSISGGSDKVSFYTSFTYLDNPGVVENTGFSKYSLRANVEGKVTDWLTMGTNLSGYSADRDIQAENLSDVFNFATQTSPGMINRTADGRYGSVHNDEDDPQANNVLQRLNDRTGENKLKNLKTRFYVNINPVKGLTLTGSYSYEYSDQDRWNKPVFLDKWNFLNETITSVGQGRTSISTYNWKSNREFMDGVIRYENKWSKLDFNAMVGASQEQYESHDYSSSKLDLVDPGIGVIGGAIGDATAGGGKSDWAMRSFFGRVNLGWADKYLLELNLRADASSRFAKDKRWGYFPSVSAAWRIDQEKFMQKSSSWLNTLKIRASYGSLGNNSVGNYDALSTYSTTNYILNNAVMMGLSQTAIANAMLTWESTYIANLAVDFAFLNNRLFGSAEIFNKTTKDILIDLPAPGVHGNSSIPKQNSAEVVNKGVEINLGWRDKAGDFAYSAVLNFTNVNNEVTKFKGGERSYSGNTFLQEGFPINIQYLRPVDRILQTDADMEIVQRMLDAEKALALAEGRAARKVFDLGTPEKGDLLYADANGDGIINADDRQTYGCGPNPKFLLGLNLTASWKGIDLSVLFQGAFGIEGFYSDFAYRPIARRGNMLNQEISDGRWYEGRTDATFPKYREASDTRNQAASSFWLADKSYLKIRNIQLGYTLPRKWMDAIKFERIRVYVSLENYFTFTSYPGLDPEIGGIGYPTMKQATFGLNITF